MRNRKIASKVGLEGDRLIIGISGEVTARTLDVVLKEITQVQTHPVEAVILDLSTISMIKLGGACYIVCLCASLMRDNITSELYLRRPPERVLTYLATMGFFTQLSLKAKLLGCEDLVRFEQERIIKRIRERITQTSYKTYSDNDSRPIVWPMEEIPRKGSSIATQDFEHTCQHFVNEARSVFDRLFSSSHFNFDEEDKHNFWQANLELYKNVFDHSNSWGIGTIHANPRKGTTVCYHDIGIGIKGSIYNSPKKIEEKIETDYDAIKWALVEGNSSKVGGSGLGLHIVENFVLERDGIIEIRSGNCLLQRKTREADWKPYDVPLFSGTQINFFIPCRHQERR